MAVWHNINKLKCPIQGCEKKSSGKTKWFCEEDGSDLWVSQEGFIKCSKTDKDGKPAHQGAMCLWKWKCQENGDHPYSNRPTEYYQNFILSLSHAVQFTHIAGAEWSAALCKTLGKQSEYARLRKPQDENGDMDNSLLQSQLQNLTLHKDPSIKCYKMTTKPKGIILIVNNVHFLNSAANRYGAENDGPRLSVAFQSVGFEVQELRDLTAQEILKQFTVFSKLNDHKKYDSLGVVIMTHGNENIVCGIDNETLRIYDLIRLFNAKNCPAMANKPKLIVFNACQGDEKDVRLDHTNTAQAMTSKDEDSSTVIGSNTAFESFKVQPANSDFVIAYSTFPGFTSFRNRFYGSYFIQQFAKLIETMHEKEHVLDILTVVGRQVAEETKERNDHHQSPMVSSTLRAKWYFTPPKGSYS